MNTSCPPRRSAGTSTGQDDCRAPNCTKPWLQTCTCADGDTLLGWRSLHPCAAPGAAPLRVVGAFGFPAAGVPAGTPQECRAHQAPGQTRGGRVHRGDGARKSAGLIRQSAERSLSSPAALGAAEGDFCGSAPHHADGWGPRVAFALCARDRHRPARTADRP